MPSFLNENVAERGSATRSMRRFPQVSVCHEQLEGFFF